MQKSLLDHALSMDNVCKRRLFSIPSQVRFATGDGLLQLPVHGHNAGRGCRKKVSWEGFYSNNSIPGHFIWKTITVVRCVGPRGGGTPRKIG